MADDELDEPWELCPENAHPRARAALGEDFFWDCTDENSPFGNDTGADALAYFQEWREEHPRGRVIHCLDALLADWEVENDHWEVLEPGDVADRIAADEFGFTQRDDSIIALAFGQVVVEGKIDPDVRARAARALGRQGTAPALELWPEAHRDERRRRLALMRELLGRDWGG